MNTANIILGIVASLAIGITFVIYPCIIAASASREEKCRAKSPEIWRYGNYTTLKNRVTSVLSDNYIYVQKNEDNESVSLYYADSFMQVSVKTYTFVRKLYLKNCYITLADVYYFAEEFNVSIDYLIGRKDTDWI